MRHLGRFATVALCSFERFTKKVSLASLSKSPTTGTTADPHRPSETLLPLPS